MALPATHLRFAAVLADRLAVADRQAYLTGTLYPDSRWVTGLPRHSTHSARFLDQAFAIDDFSLGWHIHCVCDQIQGEIHAGLMGDAASLPADVRWVRFSAAKLVQDRSDAEQGNMADWLPLLAACRTPNQESGRDIDAYLGFVKQAYRRLRAPDWTDYARLWQQVGLDRPTILQIEQTVRRMDRDAELVDRLKAGFDDMVVRYGAGWRPPVSNTG